MEATLLTTGRRWKEYEQKRDEIFYKGWEKARERMVLGYRYSHKTHQASELPHIIQMWGSSDA